MQFQVPQFIEVEDRIVGDLTIIQFIYLAGAGGFAAIMLVLLPFFIAIIAALPVVLLALALAFYKVNNKPFVFVLEASIRYFFGNKLYLWQKTEPPAPPTDKERREEAPVEQVLPKVSDSKLKELSWGLDVLDKKQ